MLLKNCPECSHQAYEIVSAKPINFKHQILVVQCASCKHVIGTLNNDETEKIIQVLSESKGQQE